MNCLSANHIEVTDLVYALKTAGEVQVSIWMYHVAIIAYLIHCEMISAGIGCPLRSNEEGSLICS